MRHNFLNLEIWIRSRNLVKTIYLLTHSFPDQEKFGLTSQIRRSAVSIPSNIAEGCGRNTDPQLVYHLDVSIGSLCELETQVYLSNDLNYITTDQAKESIDEIVEIRKMTKSLRDKIAK